MSWLKATSQAINEKRKKEEEAKRLQEALEKQKEKDLHEKWKKPLSQTMYLLESWKQLECDRILTDIQKQVLGGKLDSLELVFNGTKKIIMVTNSPKGWLFGNRQTDQLIDLLNRSGYDPETIPSLQVTRNLYKEETTSRMTYEGLDYDVTKIPIFILTIDAENILCGHTILGKLSEIKNVRILENHIDEFLSHRFSP